MKSIRRAQNLITLILLAFLVGMGILVYKLQTEASFYISNGSHIAMGYVYDRNGEILFDPDASKEDYPDDWFLDVGNFIGDNSRQMTNTLVAQNKKLLANFSFMLGEQKDGKAAIYCTLDHAVNRKVYDRFGDKNGCAVAYNYKTGEIYVCLSKPSINILDGYENVEELEEGSLLCKVFYGTVPGSTQKVSTLAAALESMGYDALMERSFNCEGVYDNNSGQQIVCHRESGHGWQDVSEAFANSCNPFFAQLVEDSELPLDDIIKTYRNMGYSVNEASEQTEIEINGISSFSAATTLTDKDSFNTQWGCMGQGETLVSPLQLMLWESAIANSSGVQTMPYFIQYTTKVKGETANTAVTRHGRQMFSAETADSIRSIMLENGANHYSELLPGTTVGVKSGTAEVKDGEEENSLLVGFVDDAEFPVAFCVVIEDRHSGEVSTSDIVSTMLQELQQSLW